MLTLRLTQVLARRLKVDLPAEVAPAGHACADWCCHSFSVARHRYLLVTHATTFYSVVMHAHGASTAPGLIKTVISGLGNYLSGAGHAFAFEQLIAPQLAEITFSPVQSRPITGVMNQFIQMAPSFLVDLSPFETSDRLNRCPVGPLDGKFPTHRFPPG
jgi:hypothetical protein